MESRFVGGKMIVDSVTGRMTGEVVTQSARDTTAGRLMKVGDGGLLAAQAAITDLTVTLTPGFYTFIENTAAGSPGAGAFTCFLIVEKATGNETGFLAFRNNGGSVANAKMWTGSRTADTGAITWVEIPHLAASNIFTGNFQTIANTSVGLILDDTDAAAGAAAAARVLFYKAGVQYAFIGYTANTHLTLSSDPSNLEANSVINMLVDGTTVAVVEPIATAVTAKSVITGTKGDARYAPIITVTTVAALGAATNGKRGHVSDALSAPVFNATATGGGTTSAPVFADGTTWRYG